MLTRKCIAVGSGKGGVGKSTTTINVALMLAKHTMRVAVVDLDPFSNITGILDLKRGADYDNRYLQSPSLTLDAVTLCSIKGCDILFPSAKSVRDSARLIKTLIFKRFANEIVARYDVLFFDLPAGISSEQNYEFLPLISRLVVVVQPEPTSHISSGGYVKAALQIAPALHIHFWHNRFEGGAHQSVRYDNVIQNYEQFVEKSLHLSPSERKRCSDISYVPRDDTLDLLNGAVRPLQSVLYKCRTILRMIYESVIRATLRCTSCRAQHYQQIYLFVGTLYPTESLVSDTPYAITEELFLYWNRFYTHSSSVSNADRLHQSQKGEIRAAIARVLSTGILQQLAQAQRSLHEFVEQGQRHSYERQAQLYEQGLKTLFTNPQLRACSVATTNSLSLLFAYTALLRAIYPHQIQRTILSFIPIRKERRGWVRDRQQQIAHLLEHNQRVHTQHYQSVKSLYPHFMRQLAHLEHYYGTSHYTFRSATSFNKTLYARIISQALHEIAYSGLGVVVGLPISSSYHAIRSGSLKLMHKVGEAA